MALALSSSIGTTRKGIGPAYFPAQGARALASAICDLLSDLGMKFSSPVPDLAPSPGLGKPGQGGGSGAQADGVAVTVASADSRTWHTSTSPCSQFGSGH